MAGDLDDCRSRRGGELRVRLDDRSRSGSGRPLAGRPAGYRHLADDLAPACVAGGRPRPLAPLEAGASLAVRGVLPRQTRTVPDPQRGFDPARAAPGLSQPPELTRP